MFLARALHRLASAGHMTPEVNHVTSQNDHMTSDQPGDSAPSGRRSVRDLYWLVGRMARLASYEAGRHPQESLKVHIHVCIVSTSIPSPLPPLPLPAYQCAAVDCGCVSRPGLHSPPLLPALSPGCPLQVYIACTAAMYCMQ